MVLFARIKEKREQMGMSKSELARRIGVSRVSVDRWECGAWQPKSTSLSKVCKALDLEMNDLIE